MGYEGKILGHLMCAGEQACGVKNRDMCALLGVTREKSQEARTRGGVWHQNKIRGSGDCGPNSARDLIQTRIDTDSLPFCVL
eukprot:6180914-Pleurochrysis_carterae.AAC.1